MQQEWAAAHSPDADAEVRTRMAAAVAAAITYIRAAQDRANYLEALAVRAQTLGFPRGRSAAAEPAASARSGDPRRGHRRAALGADHRQPRRARQQRMDDLTEGATMPAKRTGRGSRYPQPDTAGPADTDDLDVRVLSAPPAASEPDPCTGTTIAAVVRPDQPALAGPLQLATDSRVETFLLTAPGGTVVEVTHDLGTGRRAYHWIDPTVLHPPAD